jgi:hypothetical protein
MFGGELPTWLQALEKNTGECNKGALSDTCPPAQTDVLALWDRLTRIATIDRAGCNARGEDGIIIERNQPGQPHWLHMLFECVVHIRSGGCQKFLHLFCCHVSGMINFSLSFSSTGSWSKYCDHIGDLALAKLVIYVGGEASEEATKHRHMTWDTFLPEVTGSQAAHTARRRYILESISNGDIQNVSEFQHYCKRGCCICPAHTAFKIRRFFVPALAEHSPPKPISRKDWIGAATPTRKMGLIFSVGNLGQDALVLQFGNKTAKLNVHAAQCPALAAPHVYAIGPADAAAPPLAIADGAVDGPTDAQVPRDSVDEPPDPDDGLSGGVAAAHRSVYVALEQCLTWSDRNALCQKKTLAWVAKKPLAEITMMVKCLQIHERGLKTSLADSGRNFSNAQALRGIREGKRVASGISADSDAYKKREYPIINLRKGKVSDEFLCDVRHLFDDNAFDGIRMADRTEAVQVKAFVMSARSGAYEQEMIVSACKRYPLAAMDVLDENAIDYQANTLKIANDLKCGGCVDSWTEGMIGVDGSDVTQALERIQSRLFKVECKTVAKIARTDIVPIEHGHASFQRMRLARGHHTHVSDFVKTADRWSLWRFSDAAASSWSSPFQPKGDWAGEHAADGEGVVPNQTPRVKQKGHVADPWKAYCSEHLKAWTSGTFQDAVKKASRGYNALDEVGRQIYTDRAELAFQASQAGNKKPFGGCHDAIASGGSELQIVARLEPGLGEAVADTAQNRQATMQRQLQEVCAISAVAAKARIKQQKLDAAELAAFACQHRGTADIGTTLVDSTSPIAPILHDAVHCIPDHDSDMTAFRWQCPLMGQTVLAYTDIMAEKSANMKRRISEQSSAARFVYKQDAQTAIDNAEVKRYRALQLRPCNVAGRHVCAEPGFSLIRCRSKFLAGIRSMFPPKSDGLALLLDGLIVVNISQTPRDIPVVADPLAKAGASKKKMVASSWLTNALDDSDDDEPVADEECNLC